MRRLPRDLAFANGSACAAGQDVVQAGDRMWMTRLAIMSFTLPA